MREARGLQSALHCVYSNAVRVPRAAGTANRGSSSHLVGGKVLVRPGDAIIGDQDGVVVVPAAAAERVYEIAHGREVSAGGCDCVGQRIGREGSGGVRVA